MATESKPIWLELRCGCGALLFIECHPGSSYDFGEMLRLATAWTAAHKPHHVEPAKGGAP